MNGVLASDVPTEELVEDRIPTAALLRAAMEVALAPVTGKLVLAISGGRDSMGLLHAMVRWAPERLAVVATFDHATGGYATDAASLVAAEARRLGLSVVRERSRTRGVSEAAWRAARWSFLRRVARAYKARVATAHTRDDQLETVVMRELRGTGARGLAALAAPSPVVRPWLGVSRAEVARWVDMEGLAYLEDPMNASSDYLRGRVRHQLLPALEAAHPGFSEAMLALAERAAAWRRVVETLVTDRGVGLAGSGAVRVPAAAVQGQAPSVRAVLWPAICARAGVVVDARGTQALLRFTDSNRRGAYITLSGGATVLRAGDSAGREYFEVRRAPNPGLVALSAWTGSADALPPRIGGWRWRRLVAPPADPDAWSMPIPVRGHVTIRAWQAGDRIKTAGAPAGRRVTRYFAEAQVPVVDRPAWPVVLQHDVLLWVPGVCRSLAAPSRPGRPALIWYRCEREFD